MTSADVCDVTGYSRHQLQGLLRELPLYSKQQTAPRIAREFTHSDMVILAVVHMLEAGHRVRRDAIASIIRLLRKALIGPKAVNRDARLLISFDPPAVNYLTGDAPVQDGIVMSLGPIFQRVDTYLGRGASAGENAQADLKFGPALITGGRKKAT